MNERIGVDSQYCRDDVTVTPIFQSRTTVFPGGGIGEKAPVGILIHADDTLRIVSFTGTYTWWDELTKTCPDLQNLHPVFLEKTSEPQKK